MTEFNKDKIISEHGQIDMFEIRKEAAQLRAEYMAKTLKSLFRRFRVTPTVIAKEA